MIFYEKDCFLNDNVI